MKAQPGELPENLWPVGGFEGPNLSRRTSIPLNYSSMVLLLNGWHAVLVYASAATVHVVEAGFRKISSWSFLRKALGMVEYF